MSIVYQHDKRNNVTYVYESQSFWVPELKQPRAKRRLIGRLNPETGEVVPTKRRGQSKKNASDAGSETKSVEAKLTEENTRMREDVLHTKQQLQELTQTVKELKGQNEKLRVSVLRISSMLKQMNEEMEKAVAQITTPEE